MHLIFVFFFFINLVDDFERVFGLATIETILEYQVKMGVIGRAWLPEV